MPPARRPLGLFENRVAFTTRNDPVSCAATAGHETSLTKNPTPTQKATLKATANVQQPTRSQSTRRTHFGTGQTAQTAVRSANGIHIGTVTTAPNRTGQHLEGHGA